MAVLKPIVDALRTIHWFAELPDELLAQLAQFSMLRNIRAGETIFCQGEPSPYCFGIVTGEVLIQLVSKDRQVAPKALSLLGSGAVFGESSLFVESKRTAMATAHKDGQLVAILGTKFRDWIKQDTARSAPLLMGLLQTMMGHLQQTSRELSVVYGIGRLLQANKPLVERLDDTTQFLLSSLDRVETLTMYHRSPYWEEYQPLLICPKEAVAPPIAATSDLAQTALHAAAALLMDTPERRQILTKIETSWHKQAAVALVPLFTRETPEQPLLGFMVLASTSNVHAFSSSSLLLLSSISSLIAEVIQQQTRQDDSQAKARLQQSRQSFTS